TSHHRDGVTLCAAALARQAGDPLACPWSFAGETPMFGSVPTLPKTLAEYAGIIGEARVAEIRALADQLHGARVLHLNATAFGGGVAELLAALAPLMRDVGLAADWQVMHGADEFFKVTKIIHNALQGMAGPWTSEMGDLWLRYNARNAELFD